MKRICKKIFIYSLIFYLGSSMYTRGENSNFFDFTGLALYSFPLDSLLLKSLDGPAFISTQIGVLSVAQVEELLITNPETFPYMNEGLDLSSVDLSKSNQDYVVLRFKNENTTSSGMISIYFPYLNNIGVTNFIYLPGGMEGFSNVLLPYSPSLEKSPEKTQEIFTKWKYFL